MNSRIELALKCAMCGINGDVRYKMFIIDRMVRALTGCQIVGKTAKDRSGRDYTYSDFDDSKEYLAWVRGFKTVDENGDLQCEWDTGYPP